MKRPSFQWYPGDWRRDTALQACSFEARALWREMLDLMHDGEPYGHLTAGGVPIADDELARMIGKHARIVSGWLADLETRKVFSRTETGVIFSRRMVRDEHVRTARAAGGKLGGNPVLMDKGKVNLPGNLEPTPAVAVAVASAVTASSASSAREELLRSVPHRASWEAEMNAALQGMHGPVLTPEQLDRAIGDYLGNGAAKAPSLRHFRAYLTDAARVPAVTANGASDPTIAALEKWKRDTDAREQSSKSA